METHGLGDTVNILEVTEKVAGPRPSSALRITGIEWTRCHRKIKTFDSDHGHYLTGDARVSQPPQAAKTGRGSLSWQPVDVDQILSAMGTQHSDRGTAVTPVTVPSLLEVE
jgi:hypothetical protein